MGLDITQLRQETPGIWHKGNPRIHLDNAGSALMPQCVIDTMISHLQLEAMYGGYAAQEQRASVLEQTYASLAALLGGHAGDYALTLSAVDSWTKAFYSLDFPSGSNIVTAYNDYCSNYLAYLDVAEKFKTEIRVARADCNGVLDVDHLDSLIDQKTVVISVTAVPSSSGQINPIEAVGKIARKHNVLFLLDACQAVGQMPVSAEDIGCHMLVGTGRKFLRGPRGIGFLYMNAEARERIKPVMLTNQSGLWTSADTMELRSDTRIYEGWERSPINILGLKAAIDYLSELGADAVFARLKSLTDHARAEIAKHDNLLMECPIHSQASIITLNNLSCDADYIKQKLEEKNIAVNVSTVFHTRLDMEMRHVEKALRISPHVYNLSEEITDTINLIADLSPK